VVVVDGGDEERGQRGRRGLWSRHFMAGEGIVIRKLSLGVMILDLGGANQNCTKKGHADSGITKINFKHATEIAQILQLVPTMVAITAPQIAVLCLRDRI